MGRSLLHPVGHSIHRGRARLRGPVRAPLQTAGKLLETLAQSDCSTRRRRTTKCMWVDRRKAGNSSHRGGFGPAKHRGNSWSRSGLDLTGRRLRSESRSGRLRIPRTQGNVYSTRPVGCAIRADRGVVIPVRAQCYPTRIIAISSNGVAYHLLLPAAREYALYWMHVQPICIARHLGARHDQRWVGGYP